MVWNSELNVFKGIKVVDAISNKLPNGLFGKNIKLSNLVDNHY